MLSCGHMVIMGGSMLSCEVECYHVRSMLSCGGQMLSCGIKCYHVGSNVIFWDQCYHVGVKSYHVGSNVIMFCYHVMLSCDVIMGHDNTPPILFFLKTSQTRVGIRVL